MALLIIASQGLAQVAVAPAPDIAALYGPAATTTRVQFNYTGADQVITAPANAVGVYFKVWGAGGGHEIVNNDAKAGAGGYTGAVFDTTPGTQYTLVVGAGGMRDARNDAVGAGAAIPQVSVYGFGGAGFHDQGGGLSGVFTGSAAVSRTDRARALAVAGGGGGSDDDGGAATGGDRAGGTNGNGSRSGWGTIPGTLTWNYNGTNTTGRTPGTPINNPATMQGSNDGITNPTDGTGCQNYGYPANWQSAGGGGYEGGGRDAYTTGFNGNSNFCGRSGAYSGRGGSGFVAAGNRFQSIESTAEIAAANDTSLNVAPRNGSDTDQSNATGNARGVPIGRAGGRTTTYSSAGNGGGDGRIVVYWIIAPSPTIRLTKALANNRIADTDQFTVQIRRSDNITLSQATTTGTGSTVTGGSTLFTATAGTTYLLNEAASGTTTLSNYTSRITCTDPSGVMPAGELPTNAPLGVSIVPRAGATITCTLTNSLAAVPAFVCGDNSAYMIRAPNATPATIALLNTSTGAFVDNGAVAGTFNAIGLPFGGGNIMWGYRDGLVASYDATNQTFTSYPGSAASSGTVVAGAVNPVNGIYYYAASPSSAGSWTLYAFNTTTNTSLGQVAILSGLNANGDLAFDSLGNMYVTTNAVGGVGTLKRYTAAQLAAGGTLAGTTLTSTLPAPASGQYNSIAFDSTGALAIGGISGSNGFVLRANPATGAIIGTSQTTAIMLDMASCNYPNTLRVQKNLPGGRVAAGDQFQLTINGASGGNVGTTTGAETGIQNQVETEIAGPVLLVDGATTSFTEAASGTTVLGNYTQTWACVDAATNAQVASGTGASGSLTVPSNSSVGTNFLCTITNGPTADLSITKTNTRGVNGNVDQANDTVTPGPTTYTLVVTNNGPIAVTGAIVKDAPGAGITCPPANTVSIDYSGATPDSNSTVGTLTGASGIVLGQLGANETATLTFTCTVN